MNALLWVLQILLAVHTAIGAIWKSSNAARTVPSLAAIPHGLWTALIALELLCAFGLIAPAFDRRLAMLVPIAATCVGAEMLFFSAVHLASGSTSSGPLIYWLIVAVLCAIVVYGRLVAKPIRRSGLA